MLLFVVGGAGGCNSLLPSFFSSAAARWCLGKIAGGQCGGEDLGVVAFLPWAVLIGTFVVIDIRSES